MATSHQSGPPRGSDHTCHCDSTNANNDSTRKRYYSVPFLAETRQPETTFVLKKASMHHLRLPQRLITRAAWENGDYHRNSQFPQLEKRDRYGNGNFVGVTCSPERTSPRCRPSSKQRSLHTDYSPPSPERLPESSLAAVGQHENTGQEWLGSCRKSFRPSSSARFPWSAPYPKGPGEA